MYDETETFQRWSQELIAHHEAGHVIGHLEFNVPIEFVSLGFEASRPESEGGVTPAGRGTDFHEAVIYCAGPAAHEIYLANIDRDDDRETLSMRVGVATVTDQALAKHLARRSEFSYEGCADDAEQLVARRRRDVVLVAEALVARTRLSATEVEAVLSGVVPNDGVAGMADSRESRLGRRA